MEYAPQPLDLRPLFERNATLFAANAEQKQIAIRQTVAEPVIAFADSHMIDAIIRNLISNALKFTEARGAITLSARQNDQRVEMAVADTGIGMDAETVAKLFRLDVRYNQLGTAGEKGTGLGLNVCKEFAEKNGGSIAVESVVGAGTTFRVTLPTSSPNPLDAAE